jgi:hypothetical protein
VYYGSSGADRLKRAILTLFVLTVLTPLCHAEARWCSILAVGASDTMPYPPIARAARIDGVVVGRVQFLPSGAVSGFKPVFGPPLLTKAVTNQTRTWTIKTNAVGREPCESLAVFKFSLDQSGSAQPARKIQEISTSSGILSISIRSEFICPCDQPAIVGRRNRILRFFSRLK